MRRPAERVGLEDSHRHPGVDRVFGPSIMDLFLLRKAISAQTVHRLALTLRPEGEQTDHGPESGRLP